MNGTETYRTTTDGLTGFGLTTPLATGEFVNKVISVVAPTSLVSSTVWGGSQYSFSSGSKNYDAVYYRVINSIQTFSAPAQTTFTEPAYTDANPLVPAATCDYHTGGAYTATGVFSEYQIQAVYAGDTQAGNIVTCSVTDNNSSTIRICF